MRTITVFLLLFTAFINSLAQGPASDRQQFIRVEAPVIALTHVRLIDGTGAAPLEDQTIVIAEGKIQSIARSTLRACRPIAVGKQADLMIVKGNPAANISDIEKVEIVFKDGVGYDSEKLIQSVQGLVGIR